MPARCDEVARWVEERVRHRYDAVVRPQRHRQKLDVLRLGRLLGFTRLFDLVVVGGRGLLKPTQLIGRAMLFLKRL
jgi:hypothetical protein